jgi:hypothetical protein
MGTVGQLPILEEAIGQFEIADAVNPKVESRPGFAGINRWFAKEGRRLRGRFDPSQTDPATLGRLIKCD